MSATLVKNWSGRVHGAPIAAGDTRPTDGIRISGIFGEPDEQNRLRRDVMGDVTGDGKMALVRGIGNLARPDQAFYAAADPERDNRQAP